MSKQDEAIDRVESLAREYFAGSGQFLEQTSPTGKSWAGSDLGEVPAKISRGELLKDSKKLSEKDPRDFFIRVMAWGHGPAGYAAFRTRRVLDRIPTPTDGSSNHLDSWLSQLRDVAGRGPQESFEFLASGEGNVKYLGPAFSTKLLYFLSPSDNRLPILDSLVHQWLWDQGVATGDKPIELDHNDDEGYSWYIKFCDDALGLLGTTQKLGAEHDRGFVEYLIFCDQSMSDATRSLPSWIARH
jgi:hypothetical protein